MKAVASTNHSANI